MQNQKFTMEVALAANNPVLPPSLRDAWPKDRGPV